LMPLLCLIFIAITALSRLLIADIQTHHAAGLDVLWVAAAILLLSLSTLIGGKTGNKS